MAREYKLCIFWIRLFVLEKPDNRARKERVKAGAQFVDMRNERELRPVQIYDMRNEHTNIAKE